MEIVSENFDSIQSKIKNCELCQQADISNDSWSNGLRIDLHQLFLEYKIGEDERGLIIRHLKCPTCSNTNLNEFSYVGIDFSEIDIYETEAYRSSIIYHQQIHEFTEFLREYPSLAINHRIGRNLFEKINDKTFKTESINGKYFRCRKLEGNIALVQEEMKAPSLGVSGQGRYNYDGQSHFYISSSKNTAISEVLQGSKRDVIVWVQKFRINDPIDNLLDLRVIQIYDKNELGLLHKALFYSGFLVEKKGEVGNWKPDYFLTRFIMDCAKYAKYNGILYNSAYDISNYNVVLFNGNDGTVIPKGKPKIVRPNKISRQSDSFLPF